MIRLITKHWYIQYTLTFKTTFIPQFVDIFYVYDMTESNCNKKKHATNIHNTQTNPRNCAAHA